MTLFLPLFNCGDYICLPIASKKRSAIVANSAQIVDAQGQNVVSGLHASYTQIGVGYCASGNYWTQMFIG